MNAALKFTSFLNSFKEGENGELIPFNNSVTRTVRDCCEGYAGTTCEPDLCQNLTCPEDPNAKCTIVNRCEQRFPLFVDENGFLSNKCTQPKETEENHLCPGTQDVCSAGAVCPDFPDSGDVVCLGRGGCDCEAGETWYLQQNGREVDCYLYQ